MTDSVTRGRRPLPLAYRRRSHDQFVTEMIRELVAPRPDDSPAGTLGTRTIDDPTVALIDAWATVAEIIQFYQDRIAAEGYLATAVEPESVLALASLVGYRPRSGLAATTWLAYTLSSTDPKDTVPLPAGLLVQSVPRTGELPQLFETTEDLVARPSWNTLRPRTELPLTIPPGGVDALAELRVAGTSTRLTQNDVILIKTADPRPAPVHVRWVVPDLITGSTTVTLRPKRSDLSQPAPDQTMAADSAPAAVANAAVDPAAADNPQGEVTKALDALIKALLPSATAKNGIKGRDVADFQPMSSHPLEPSPRWRPPTIPDAATRLSIALQPTLAASLDAALATTRVSPVGVQAVFALRVKASPFGVQVPPRARFDDHGQPRTPEEWPIGDVQTLTARFALSTTEGTTAAPSLLQAVFAVATGRATVLPGTTVIKSAGFPGTLTVTERNNTFTVRYVREDDANTTKDDANTLTLEFTWADNNHTVTVTDTRATTSWNPRAAASQRLTLGSLRLTSRLAATSDDPSASVLTISVERPLPIINRKVLDLDATYDTIVAGSWVVIDRATTADQRRYPVMCRVQSADPVAVNRYGLSLKVTRLLLDEEWIGADALLLSDLRELSVRAQPVPIEFLPVPIGDELTGNQIELDGLFSGIDSGRPLLLTGVRADLGTASVGAGEIVTVATVGQTCHDGGDTLHTLLTLQSPLRNRYRLDSVRLHGNVVKAHQGATIRENLVPNSGDRAHPTFTLAQAPVLADPAPTAAGFVSSLTVTVDGRRWSPVSRFSGSTPPRSYVTGTDHHGRTTIVLGEPLSHPDSTVTATYRVGHGALGNVRAHQLTQALSSPLTVAGVDNPLPATGGADPVGPDVVRANAPVGLEALARVVSVADAADIALSWAGIGKADARLCGDGRRQVLAVTVAGVTAEPLEPDAELCIDVAAAIRAAGDPDAPVVARPAVLSIIILDAEVGHDPDTTWDTVERAVRAALLDAFGYARRRLGEDVVLSDLVAIAHRVPAVRSFVIKGIGHVEAGLAPSALAGPGFGGQLKPPPSDGRILIPSTNSGSLAGAAHVAYLSGLVAETMILSERRP